MRTTLDIPEDLVNEAWKLTHSRTKTDLIKLALESIIKQNKILGLKKYRGKLDLDLDINVLRNR